MKNQIERFKTIASAFIASYLNDVYHDVYHQEEFKGFCGCKFTEIRDLISKCDGQDITLRTFQRDIIDLKKHFGLTITSSGSRDGVYLLRLDKVAMDMIESRKLSLEI